VPLEHRDLARLAVLRRRHAEAAACR
jgi:hypothetical protein